MLRRLTYLFILSFVSISTYAQVFTSTEASEEELDMLDPMSQYFRDDYEEDGSKNKIQRLLDKANSYYNKMWYAEAAEIYDKIYQENPKEASNELLQKAGDAHYFNSNMKKANEYYEKLFKANKKELTNQELFRYGHTLQGIGRHTKAKRIMKLLTTRLMLHK